VHFIFNLLAKSHERFCHHLVLVVLCPSSPQKPLVPVSYGILNPMINWTWGRFKNISQTNRWNTILVWVSWNLNTEVGIWSSGQKLITPTTQPPRSHITQKMFAQTPATQAPHYTENVCTDTNHSATQASHYTENFCTDINHSATQAPHHTEHVC
jgi:hypothetical protein